MSDGTTTKPVQVCEGRWRTRGNAIRNVTPTPQSDGRAAAFPWWDAAYRQTWRQNGRYHSGGDSPLDLVGYLGPIEPEPEPQPEPQATEFAPPDGWRVVPLSEALRGGDEYHPGLDRYIRRIESGPQPEPQLTPDDPSGPGWRDVEPDELLQDGDMLKNNTGLWLRTGVPGRLAREGYGGTYRRRIEPQQASDSEPETMEDLRRRLAECEVLLAEADRGGQQVNAELQQLREQLQTLTRERDRYRNQLAGAIEHSSAAEAQAQLVDRLQAWLRPVLELVAEHPEDASPLAVAVLGYLPGIASRLIEE